MKLKIVLIALLVSVSINVYQFAQRMRLKIDLEAGTLQEMVLVEALRDLSFYFGQADVRKADIVDAMKAHQVELSHLESQTKGERARTPEISENSVELFPITFYFDDEGMLTWMKFAVSESLQEVITPNYKKSDRNSAQKKKQ